MSDASLEPPLHPFSLTRRLVADAPVRLTVMDLFGNRSSERIRLDPSPERHLEELATTDGVTIASDRGDRVRYRNLLSGAHFGIAPFRPGCPWSMSVIDCQAMGLPVIGPARASADIVHAFGHGHVGLAAGPVTGRIVADIIAGRKPGIDLGPFAARRFW